ncbi:SET and MYND domain-containing protein 4 [Drosophila ficusphila]|uniref:SET and MYND domain-containing protein 4 n=1 Tax=Drosophila ficusphila TaxID=30025 RepID=UPI0007E6DE8A|nr:SET and MYND domain-containing protein 4 [Drosophila ficusphila]XP_017045069.1 SET and MYND domain-containing protein 4 [Drosophila ficusphila]
MERLAKVFSKQDELIDLDGGFKDEFETIKSLDSLPAEKLERFRQLTLKLLKDLEQPHDREKCAERSRILREEGNIVFRGPATENGSSQDAERVLKACRLYTKAVFEAEDAVDELALAYANRGMALQEYGFYSEAYDDCANALECGYPERLRHKVIMRQAHCAWKLQKIGPLEAHITSLEQLQLNENFLQQLNNLKEKLQLLKSEPEKPSTKEEGEKKTLEEISTDPGPRGRYMVAQASIKQGQIIFSERASCFVPLEQRLICQQCAASLMSAPIPCCKCHQRVVYCSRKCREAHLGIHKYECAAYGRDLLKLLGVSHLALRMLLAYIPLMLPQLQVGTDAQQIWEGIIKLVKTPNGRETAPEYLLSLRMVSHLDQASKAELVYHALCANLLQVYLKEHTDFFDQFHSSLASTKEWQQITSALILRFAGQLLANGHVGDALLPVGLEPNEFALLQPDMWEKPRHLKVGQLHNMAHSELITAINLPYLSLCNHSCVPSIRTKFDGCSVVNYAANNILAGEEIFNCYTRDFRNSLKLQRSEPLMEVYKFKCNCDKCSRTDPDQDYLTFHQYRCEQPNCRKVFLPQIEPQKSNLRWWLSPNENHSIICTVCKERQLFSWYNGFLDLIESCADPSRRQALFQAFDDLDKWLVDHHSLKRNLAEELITACFVEIDEGTLLDELEYKKLANIIRRQLEGIAAQCGDTSMEYIVQMTFLMDLIALKKCQSKKEELLELKEKLEYLANEHRAVFLNYYNDFIEQQCK